MILSAKPAAQENGIAYHWGTDHMAIKLGNRTPGRIKMLYWGEFILTFGMTTVILAQIFWLESRAAHVLALGGSAILYLLAAYRFLSRMFYNEHLLIDNKSLTIIRRTIFNKQTDTYSWAQMGPLRYAGKAGKTDHPLKGKCYDYFGFETQEHLIQTLHQEGNISFNYKGKNVCFAKDVYSWDAEEMMNMMRIQAGSSLRLGPEWANMQQTYGWDEPY